METGLNRAAEAPGAVVVTEFDPRREKALKTNGRS